MGLRSAALTAPDTRVQRTRSSPSAHRSPLTRYPLGHATIAIAIITLLAAGCASSSPETYGVIAYQADDGVWHEDVSRVVAPVATNRVEPIWPPEYRTASNQGTVVMKLLVSRDGIVQDVVVLKSVNGVMDKQAIAQAWQRAYTPATLDGKPVPVWLKAYVRWKLS